jgi:hypothetical protein
MGRGRIIGAAAVLALGLVAAADAAADPLGGVLSIGRSVARATFGGVFGHPIYGRRYHHRHTSTAVRTEPRPRASVADRVRQGGDWVGPVFWPYALDDLTAYAFGSRGVGAAERLWTYGYANIFGAVFAPGAQRTGAEGATGGRTRLAAAGASDASASAGIAPACGSDAAANRFPAAEIGEAVEPNEVQRPLLAKLEAATKLAIERMNALCPVGELANPVARVDAVEGRLRALRQAANIIHAPLDNFYTSLSDEQKARLNALTTATTAATRVCGERAAQVPSWPTPEIERLLRPSDEQRPALEGLRLVMAQAAETLKATCPDDPPQTPPGRLAAAEARLHAMWYAVKTLQPALNGAYGVLSDEQKAQFGAIALAPPRVSGRR